MASGFLTEYGGAGAQDLDDLFEPGTSFNGSNYTGFWSEYRGQDLANLYAPRSSGGDLGYNTGFVALDGRDLREWFAKRGSVVVWTPGFSGNVACSQIRDSAEGYTYINVGLQWASDGKIYLDWNDNIGSSGAQTGYWGIGTPQPGYYLKLTLQAGTTPAGSPLNTWIDLAGGASLAVGEGSVGSVTSAFGMMYLANAPSDANIISSAQWQLEAELY